MFAEIKPSTPDPIMSLMEAYLQDRNPRKVNLGIGLYYDERGEVPLMRAVELAEQRLLAQQLPHGYPPIEGSVSFASQIQTLLLGPAAPEHALATVQTVGGSGALKLAADFLVHFLQRKEIWVSDPTWANHQAIFSGAGLQVNSYPYFDNLRGELRFADMLATLQTLPAGTAVLLHPCCHNPTGTDLSHSQWHAFGRGSGAGTAAIFRYRLSGFWHRAGRGLLCAEAGAGKRSGFYRRQLFFEKYRPVRPAGRGINRALRQRADRRQRPGGLKDLNSP